MISYSPWPKPRPRRLIPGVLVVIAVGVFLSRSHPPRAPSQNSEGNTFQAYRLRSGVSRGSGVGVRGGGKLFASGRLMKRYGTRFKERSRSTSASASADMPNALKNPNEYEYIIIGSGVGGLSCGATLAKEGHKVLVVEAHDRPGGCCHSFKRKTPEGIWEFEVGPSVLQSLGDEQSVNPLRMVLDELGETFDSVEYDGCGMWSPDGYWRYQLGPEAAEGGVKDMLRKMSKDPDAAINQYDDLKDDLKTISKIHDACPLTSLRQDWGALLTTGISMVPMLVRQPWAVKELPKILDSFHHISGPIVKETHLKRFIDILSFFSGFPANGTIGAAMIYCLQEFHKPNASLAIPLGGSPAIVNALNRALEKGGGELKLKAKVDEILTQDGHASGVRLVDGEEIRATKGVISGATIWDTAKLLRDHSAPGVSKWKDSMSKTPAQGTILHLFLGVNGEELPLSPEGKTLDPSQLVIRDWNRPLSDPQNVITVSIPTLLDPTIAPKGKHIVHVYTSGTEPYELWESVDGDKEAYDALKQERLEVLWEAVDRILPGVRDRVEVSVDGTPLTHAKFLHRHQGSYGPALPAGKRLFGWMPIPEIPLLLYDTPVKGLLRCGDSTFPGPGVPAAVASGAIVANTLIPWYRHASKILQRTHSADIDRIKTAVDQVSNSLDKSRRRVGEVVSLLKESYSNSQTQTGYTEATRSAPSTIPRKPRAPQYGALRSTIGGRTAVSADPSR